MTEKVGVDGSKGYELTDAEVIRALREVAAESPERVYEAPLHMKDGPSDRSCYYVHRDESGIEEAGCFIGTVLHRLGVSLSDLTAVEDLAAVEAMSNLAVTGVSDRVLRFLRRVQFAQDYGNSWSRALSMAHAEDASMNGGPLFDSAEAAA